MINSNDNDTFETQKAKLTDSNKTDLRELGFLRGDFSKEDIEALDTAMLESMSKEELTLWYDADPELTVNE